jgi:hypothetical protein
MTGDKKLRTLKDQLESETADLERSAAEDSERYNGGDWWQLTDEEEPFSSSTGSGSRV